MSREFHTLKEKIQYLFAKIDAGEAILPVELDLLKAYSNGLAQEIESNGTDLLEHFSKKEKQQQKETAIDKQESKSQKQETAPVKSGESEKIAAPEAEKSAPPTTEKKMQTEPISNEQTEVPDEKEKKSNKEETASEQDIDSDKVVLKEDYDAANKNETIVSPEVEKTDVENLKDNSEKSPGSETEKVHGGDNGRNTNEEDELDEDYGIGLKYKQAKPLRELIDLSEKYIFIQCLFDHDPDRFSKALRKMDEAGGVSEALDILNNYLVVADEAEKQSEELLQKMKTYLRIRFS